MYYDYYYMGEDEIGTDASFLYPLQIQSELGAWSKAVSVGLPLFSLYTVYLIATYIIHSYMLHAIGNIKCRMYVLCFIYNAF